MKRKIFTSLLLAFSLLAMFNTVKAQGWVNKFSPDLKMAINSVYQLSDGSYTASGANDTGTHTRMVHVDGNGNETGHIDYDSIYNATTNIAQNGGYVILGNNPYDTVGHSRTYNVLKLNSAGGKQWLKTIHHSYNLAGQVEESYMAIDTTDDGGFMCAINTYDTLNTYTHRHLYLKRLDSNGNIIATHSYFEGDSIGNYAFDLINSKDGGFLLSVISGNSNLTRSLIKINAGGDILWTYNAVCVGGALSGVFATITRNGNIYAAYGSARDTNFLAKLDQNGNRLWLRSYSSFALSEYFAGRVIEIAPNRLACAISTAVHSSNRVGVCGFDTLGRYDPDFLTPFINFQSLHLTNPTYTIYGGKNLIHTIDGGFVLGGGIIPYQQTTDENSAFLAKTDSAGGLLNSTIWGRVYFDANQDCIPDTSEPGIAGAIVSFVSARDSFTTTVNSLGYYQALVDTGVYHATVTLPPGYLSLSGCDSFQYHILPNTANNISFATQTTYSYPYLVLNAYSYDVLELQRTSVNYVLNYCNTGGVPFTGTIAVTFDTLAHIQSSSIPWDTIETGNVYIFRVDSLPPGQCAQFTVHYRVYNAHNFVGRSLCIDAHAYADTIARIPANWDGSNLLMKAECSPAQDSVIFTLKNLGTGNMHSAQSMVVIEDNVILMQLPVQLNAAQTYRLAQPANGSTWRATIQQTIDNPYSKFTTAASEGCGAQPPHFGYINQFPINGFYGFDFETCIQVKSSYDPNHKSVAPAGTGSNHIIDTADVLTYAIEFQNTGNAPAQLVRIIDTLAPYLNPLSIKPAVSSAPCTMQFLASNVVAFTFYNINLPDTSAGDSASQGFVSFTIYQKPYNALGSVINNNAAIYFDYNPAIITNTATVTLGELLINDVQVINNKAILINAYPNPFSNQTCIKVDGAAFTNMQLNIYDLTGRLISQQRVTNTNQFIVDRKTLSTGSYIFEISSNDKPIARGKIIAE